MQSTLPDNPMDELADALIRCKGKEDNAIEGTYLNHDNLYLTGILSGELPKRPAVPQEFIKEYEEEQKKKNEQAQKQYDQQLKAFEAQIASTPSDAPKLLVDITDPTNKDNQQLLSERVTVLKSQITKQKEETERLSKEVDKLKQKAGASTAIPSAKLLASTTSSESNNRLFLPGECEAIQNGEARVFTFKPEVRILVVLTCYFFSVPFPMKFLISISVSLKPNFIVCSL